MRLVGLILLMLMLASILSALTGCAARNYSSTDHKYGEERWDYKKCPPGTIPGWCYCTDRRDGEHCRPER